MEEMSKKTKRLEKENLNLTRKQEATNKNIFQMAEERSQSQLEIERLGKGNEKLKKLCRAMQTGGYGAAGGPPAAVGEAEFEGETESEYDDEEYDEDDEEEGAYDDEETEEEGMEAPLSQQQQQARKAFGPPPPPPPPQDLPNGAPTAKAQVNGQVNGTGVRHNSH